MRAEKRSRFARLVHVAESEPSHLPRPRDGDRKCRADPDDRAPGEAYTRGCLSTDVLGRLRHDPPPGRRGELLDLN